MEMKLSLEWIPLHHGDEAKLIEWIPFIMEMKLSLEWLPLHHGDEAKLGVDTLHHGDEDKLGVVTPSSWR